MTPLLCLLAYLIGSIPFSVILGKALKGLDVREHGSGNPGATNAIRVLGWKIGLLVLTLDMAKGLTPILIARTQLPSESEFPLVAIGFCAILGHVLSLFLNFKGGKGVATSAGVVACLDPLAFSCALTVFALTLAASRFVSLASLLAVSTLTVASLALQVTQEHPLQALQNHSPRLAFFSLIGTLVFIRHTGNIKRLWNGTESKLGDKSPPSPENNTPHAPPNQAQNNKPGKNLNQS